MFKYRRGACTTVEKMFSEAKIVQPRRRAAETLRFQEKGCIILEKRCFLYKPIHVSKFTESRNKILETKYWNAERFELDGEEKELNVARERRIECKMLKELIFRSEDFKESCMILETIPVKEEMEDDGKHNMVSNNNFYMK